MENNYTTKLADFIQRHHFIKDGSAYHQLQEDLIEHQLLLYSQR